MLRDLASPHPSSAWRASLRDDADVQSIRSSDRITTHRGGADTAHEAPGGRCVEEGERSRPYISCACSRDRSQIGVVRSIRRFVLDVDTGSAHAVERRRQILGTQAMTRDSVEQRLRRAEVRPEMFGKGSWRQRHPTTLRCGRSRGSRDPTDCGGRIPAPNCAERIVTRWGCREWSRRAGRMPRVAPPEDRGEGGDERPPRKGGANGRLAG